MAQAVGIPQARTTPRHSQFLAWATRSWPAATLLWLVAAAVWLSVIAKARSGAGDFSVIWMGVRAFESGHDMYLHQGSTYAFLYPPSAALLLAPLGALSLGGATAAFAVVQSAAISAACVLSLQLAGRIRRWTVPLAVLAGGLALPARNSMWLGNPDGVIVALELLMLVAAARNRWLWAAIAFGIGLALKPILLPLVVLFLFARQWKTLVLALAIPVALSVAAIALGANGSVFVTKVVPYLWGGQSGGYQAVNISFAGAASFVHLPSPLTLAVRAALLVALGACVITAWRGAAAPADRGIQLAEAASIVMLTVLLVFSYTWAHYILFLLPLFALYGLKRSLVRGWLALLSIYLLLAPDDVVWMHIWLGLSQVRLILGMLILAAALLWASGSETRNTNMEPKAAIKAGGYS